MPCTLTITHENDAYVLISAEANSLDEMAPLAAALSQSPGVESVCVAHSGYTMRDVWVNGTVTYEDTSHTPS